MLNFLIFVQNYTLIRISGIAIGITLYPAFLRLKLIKEDEKINIKFKLIFLIINLLVALVLTRIPLKEFLQIIPYILIGLSLPILKFLTFYTENKFKK
jgi:energy-coupling factor transporter transmembrane protein EcfT